VAVALVDLDHFKLVNDAHGHALGDTVLARVSDALRSAVRESDTVARTDGDQFAVLLEGLETGADCAGEVAEVAAGLQHALSRVDISGQRQTASIGVAVCGGEARVDDVLRRADEAIYLAKSRGRSQVVVAGPPQP
jgi:diguanylate cyclase (GGDEF)-like protein